MCQVSCRVNHSGSGEDAVGQTASESNGERRAPKLLASSRHGVNAALLVHGHGFKRRVLAGLIRRKLTAGEREVAMAGAKPIEVVRVRIMAAGRRAIEELGANPRPECV